VVVAILINGGKATMDLDVRVTGTLDYRFVSAHVTDRSRRCERSGWLRSLTPESVTTLRYSSEAARVGGE
jgi:hypothetical protein